MLLIGVLANMNRHPTWTDEVFYEYLDSNLSLESREFFLDAWNSENWRDIYFCSNFISLAKRMADPEGEKYHTLQQIIIDKNGTARFRENKIVTFLLDKGGYDLNDLAAMKFTDADSMQFAQLIGYSVSGFGSLSYASDDVVKHADSVVKEMLK